MTIFYEILAFTWSAKLFQESKCQQLSAKRLSGGKQGKELKQIFRSIRPLRIQCGSFFPIKRSTLFQFGMVVIENTITVVLI